MTIDSYRARYGLEPDFRLHDNAVLRGILERRSHRRFTDLRVDDDLVRSLLAAAFSAPSKSDLQQVSVVRITDRDKLARIAGRDDKAHWLAGASEFMVWCGDNRRTCL